MNPMATPFVQTTERLTECTDTFELVAKFAVAQGVSPMIMRATSWGLYVVATQQYTNELSLRTQTEINYGFLCDELHRRIPTDTAATFFVNGEEIYVEGL